MDVFKLQREKMARLCREEWAQRSDGTSVPSIAGLSEIEQRALAVAVMAGRVGDGANVPGAEISEVIARAERAKKEWGIFQIAMLGEAGLRLNEKKELLARFSKARIETPSSPVVAGE